MYGKSIDTEHEKNITLVDRIRRAWHTGGIKLETED